MWQVWQYFQIPSAATGFSVSDPLEAVQTCGTPPYLLGSAARPPAAAAALPALPALWMTRPRLQLGAGFRGVLLIRPWPWPPPVALGCIQAAARVAMLI